MDQECQDELLMLLSHKHCVNNVRVKEVTQAAKKLKETYLVCSYHMVLMSAPFFLFCDQALFAVTFKLIKKRQLSSIG